MLSSLLKTGSLIKFTGKTAEDMRRRGYIPSGVVQKIFLKPFRMIVNLDSVHESGKGDGKKITVSDTTEITFTQEGARRQRLKNLCAERRRVETNAALPKKKQTALLDTLDMQIDSHLRALSRS